MAKAKKDKTTLDELIEGIVNGKEITRSKKKITEKVEMKKDPRDEKIKQMAKDLWGFRFNDEYGVDNYFLDQFIQEYVGNFFPDMVKWFLTIMEKQKTKSESYGDIDWTFEKLVNEDKKKVLYLDHHCSCAPVTRYIMIYDYSDYEEQFHIREIHDNSDYKSKNQKNKYPQRLGLKWYKDRNYSLKHDEKLHWGPLGSSYGDLRDKGYILSAKRWKWTEEANRPWDFDRGMLTKMHAITFVGTYLNSSARELEYPEED